MEVKHDQLQHLQSWFVAAEMICTIMTDSTSKGAPNRDRET